MGIEPGRINDDRLYRGLDQVGKQKDRLCAHLMERYRTWFGVQFEFLLYDVTSTFFEGMALGNKKAARRVFARPAQRLQAGLHRIGVARRRDSRSITRCLRATAPT